MPKKKSVCVCVHASVCVCVCVCVRQHQGRQKNSKKSMAKVWETTLAIWAGTKFCSAGGGLKNKTKEPHKYCGWCTTPAVRQPFALQFSCDKLMRTCSVFFSHDLWLGRPRKFCQGLQVLPLQVNVILDWFRNQALAEELKHAYTHLKFCIYTRQ